MTAHPETIRLLAKGTRSPLLGDEAGAAFAGPAGCQAVIRLQFPRPAFHGRNPSAFLHAARGLGWINVRVARYSTKDAGSQYATWRLRSSGSAADWPHRAFCGQLLIKLY